MLIPVEGSPEYRSAISLSLQAGQPMKAAAYQEKIQRRQWSK